MAGLVIDVSAVLGVALDDEVSAYADSVFAALVDEPGRVPSIFWFELRNVLVVSERRSRITPEQTLFFLEALGDFSLEIDAVPPEAGVMLLARRHELTVYDAAYLDLAIRTGSRLATLDKKLRSTADKSGVEIFGIIR